MIADRLENMPLPSFFLLARGQAQVALCDVTGHPKFHLRADADFIYFEDPRVTPTRATNGAVDP